MKAPTFKRQFDPAYKGSPLARTKEESGKSMTRPDMTRTIPELLANHTRGLGLGNIYREGIYTDMEIDRFDDITDMVEKRRLLRQQQQELDDKIREERKAAKEAKDKQNDPDPEKPEKVSKKPPKDPQPEPEDD